MNAAQIKRFRMVFNNVMFTYDTTKEAREYFEVCHPQAVGLFDQFLAGEVLPEESQVVPVVGVKVDRPKIERQSTGFGRKQALEFISLMKASGTPNKVIIDMLIMQHNFKKTTATTYTYSVPAV
jgi:hypothetical protein